MSGVGDRRARAEAVGCRIVDVDISRRGSRVPVAAVLRGTRDVVHLGPSGHGRPFEMCIRDLRAEFPDQVRERLRAAHGLESPAGIPAPVAAVASARLTPATPIPILVVNVIRFTPLEWFSGLRRRAAGEGFAVEPRIGSASEGCRCPGHGIPRGRHCRGPASCRDRPSVAHTLGPTRSRPSSGSRPRMVSARVPASASGPRRLLVSSRRRVHPPVVLVQPVDLPPAVQEDEAEVVIAPGRERLPKTLEVDGREELWPSRRPRRPSRRS